MQSFDGSGLDMFPLASGELHSKWGLRGVWDKWGLGVGVLPQALCPVMSWHSPGRAAILKFLQRGLKGSYWPWEEYGDQRLFHRGNCKCPVCCPLLGKCYVAHIFGLLPNHSWLPIAYGIRVKCFSVTFKICSKLKLI